MNAKLGVISEICCTFAMTINFRFPQNGPSKAVWGIFLFLMQRYKIFMILAIKSLDLFELICDYPYVSHNRSMLVIRNKDSIFLPIYIRFGEIFLAHGYFKIIILSTIYIINRTSCKLTTTIRSNNAKNSTANYGSRNCTYTSKQTSDRRSYL